MTHKGRVWVLGWLIFIPAVMAWVVARQTSSVVTAADLNQLRDDRSALEAKRAVWLRRIRDAESRAVLVPRAESLGLRLPADSEIVIIDAPIPGGR